MEEHPDVGMRVFRALDNPKPHKPHNPVLLRSGGEAAEVFIGLADFIVCGLVSEV